MATTSHAQEGVSISLYIVALAFVVLGAAALTLHFFRRSGGQQPTPKASGKKKGKKKNAAQSRDEEEPMDPALNEDHDLQSVVQCVGEGEPPDRATVAC